MGQGAGSRVETSRFQAMGQMDSQPVQPPTAAARVWYIGSQAGAEHLALSLPLGHLARRALRAAVIRRRRCRRRLQRLARAALPARSGSTSRSAAAVFALELRNLRAFRARRLGVAVQVEFEKASSETSFFTL